MLSLLANIDASQLIEKLKSFQMPSQQEYIAYLAGLEHRFETSLALIVLFGCGLVYLLQGWKIFKILVVINAAILGVLVGSQFGQTLKGANSPLFCGIAGGLLLAVLAMPAMKFAISIMGALAGGALGYGLWAYITKALGKEALLEHAWAGALIGLVTLGLLAFVIFRLVVMIFTSLQGSLMTVTGALGLLLMSSALRDNLQTSLETNVHVLPVLVGVPAIIGFAFQYSGILAKEKKKKKAAAG